MNPPFLPLRWRYKCVARGGDPLRGGDDVKPQEGFHAKPQRREEEGLKHEGHEAHEDSQGAEIRSELEDRHVWRFAPLFFFVVLVVFVFQFSFFLLRVFA